MYQIKPFQLNYICQTSKCPIKQEKKYRKKATRNINMILCVCVCISLRSMIYLFIIGLHSLHISATRSSSSCRTFLMNYIFTSYYNLINYTLNSTRLIFLFYFHRLLSNSCYNHRYVVHCMIQIYKFLNEQTDEWRAKKKTWTYHVIRIWMNWKRRRE